MCQNPVKRVPEAFFEFSGVVCMTMNFFPSIYRPHKLKMSKIAFFLRPKNPKTSSQHSQYCAAPLLKWISRFPPCPKNFASGSPPDLLLWRSARKSEQISILISDHVRYKVIMVKWITFIPKSQPSSSLSLYPFQQIGLRFLVHFSHILYFSHIITYLTHLW